MCSPGIHLQFCTCDADALAALEADPKSHVLIWTLYQKSPPTFGIGWVGRILMPSRQLGSELTETMVLEQLNAPSCFDFDYQPQSGDQLRIRHANDLDYMYFEYQAATGWKPSWPSMREEREAIRSGRLDLQRHEK